MNTCQIALACGGRGVVEAFVKPTGLFSCLRCVKEQERRAARPMPVVSCMVHPAGRLRMGY